MAFAFTPDRSSKWMARVSKATDSNTSAMDCVSIESRPSGDNSRGKRWAAPTFAVRRREMFDDWPINFSPPARLVVSPPKPVLVDIL